MEHKYKQNFLSNGRFNQEDLVSFRFLNTLFYEIDNETNGDGFYGEFGQNLKKHKDYPWLRWLNHTIATAPVGKLPKSVIKQIPPILNAWAKKGNKVAALMTQTIIERLFQERLAGNHNVSITTIMYNTLMDAWSKSGDRSAAYRCEDILHWMVSVDAEPDVVSYTIVIDAWSSASGSGIFGAAKRAEEILNMMQNNYEDRTSGIQPNTQTYNALIDAYARAGGIDMAENALRVLKDMNNIYVEKTNRYIRPDVFSYNAVISAFATCAPRRSDAILKILEKSCEENNPANVQPNCFCYSTCIDAYAKSNEKNKAMMAYQLLQRMKRTYLSGVTTAKPNVVVFTTVINACAYCLEIEKPIAFDIACETFEELRQNPEYGSPNYATYTQMLTACSRLLPSSAARTTIMRKLFKQSCIDGNLSKVSYHIYSKSALSFVEKEKARTYDDLPNEWKTNFERFNRSKKARTKAAGRNNN